MYISETVIHVSVYAIEEKTLKVFFHAQLTHMHQLLTFADVNTTGTV
jgi:hypothetical protein